MENQIISRQEYYSSSSTKTTSFTSKESKHFVNGMFSTDSVDGCIENGHQRCVSFESKSYITNGSSKSISETSSYKEFSNGIEKKSFIQQRVERLYGPGALAQGFFVSRRQKDRLSESESQCSEINGSENTAHSKSMTDNLIESEALDNNIRQSISNPVLPVLRHLRPEFRAQLPIISSKKIQNTDTKSDISIKDEIVDPIRCLEEIKNPDVEINGNKIVPETCEDVNGTCEKDGHYFLQIIEMETRRLLASADKVEKEELENSELSEEIKGKLRAASGKARLLTSQKMQQFKGLCTKNITQDASEAFPTTSEDLQGFWDMVLLQVEQVDALFAEIDLLRKNNWKDPNPTNETSNTNKSKKQPRKVKFNPTSTPANDVIRKLKEAQRKKMIEERRKAMRENNIKPADSIEFFVADAS